jgi:glycosyltransferase involved in cell wall biosynthesis
MILSPRASGAANFSIVSDFKTMTRERATLRVLLHGLVYFCRKLPGILSSPGWELRHYDPNKFHELLPAAAYLQRCDLAYLWGGRLTMGKFLSVARLLQKKQLIMFWCGSDTVEAYKDYEAGLVDPWIAEKVHWAGSPWLADEVRAMGLQCEYVPATWVDVPAALPPMPAKFSVLAHLSSATRVSLYGIDLLFEVARKLPNVEFRVVGILPGESLRGPANVKIQGRVPSMVPLFSETSVLWRPARHDGLSFIALEALGHGRHVLWSYPFKGATVAKDAVSGYQEIQRMLDLHLQGKLEINRIGADHIASNFTPDRIRENILSRWRQIITSQAGAPEARYCGDQPTN